MPTWGRILTTAFVALLFWIAWIVVSVKFGVSDGASGAKLSGGQQAALVGTFVPALVLTCAAVVMLIRAPFKARKRRRAAEGRPSTPATG